MFSKTLQLSRFSCTNHCVVFFRNALRDFGAMVEREIASNNEQVARRRKQLTSN